MAINSYLDTINVQGPDITALADAVGFPASEFSKRIEYYTKMENWFNGTNLEETVGTGTDEQELYPAQYNPYPEMVQKHCAMLFGHYEIDEQPIVRQSVKPPNTDKKFKDLAQTVEEVLNTFYYENNVNALLMDNATISQIYGGCVFKLSLYPDVKNDPLRTIGLTLSIVHPKYFVAIPSGSSFWNLREAWVVRPISLIEAKEIYFYTVGPDEEDDSDQLIWLVEHFTATKIVTTVGGKPAYKRVRGKKIPLDQKNPFGFVPLVYIPHERNGKFYGESMISGTEGLIKEINLRLGDYGDAVNTDSHNTFFISGQGNFTVDEPDDLGTNIRVVSIKNHDVGMAKEPNANVSQAKQSAHASMGELIDNLLQLLYKRMHLPPVAYGVDEGSQRSAETLVARMWPLVAHAQMERIYWTVGLNRLALMAIAMLRTKEDTNGEGEKLGLTEDTKKLKYTQKWQDFLPKDRQTLIDELVSRFGANMTSLDKVQELLGDVEDPEEEKKLIYKGLKMMAEIQASSMPKPAPGQPAKSGSTVGKTSTKTQATKKPQDLKPMKEKTNE